MTTARVAATLLLLLLLLGVDARAAETSLRLDGGSFLRAEAADGSRMYRFPENAWLRLRFGALTGNAIPVDIPTDGLKLGVLTGDRLAPLEVSLAAPATGRLVRTGPGQGVLELTASVWVNPVGGLRSRRYELNLSADVVRKGATGTGYLQLAITEAAASAKPDPTERFTVQINGDLDSLPADFE